MGKLGVLCSLALIAAVTAPASAGYVFFENFENGVSGWNVWTQAGTSSLTAQSESATGSSNPLTPVGNIAPESGGNAQLARLGGTPVGNYNGGLWKQVSVPVGVPLTFDGFWRCYQYKRNSQWSEVILWDGAFSPVNGTDYNPPGQGKQNGNLADSELIYKLYSNNDSANVGWGGSFSATTTSPPAPWQATKVGPNIPASTTGTITILLKYGHTSTSAKSIDWDDIYITPEPATLGVLALGLPLFLRRRRM